MYYGKISNIIVVVKVVLVHPLWRVKASKIKDPNSRHVNHVRTDVFPDTSEIHASGMRHDVTVVHDDCLDL